MVRSLSAIWANCCAPLVGRAFMTEQFPSCRIPCCVMHENNHQPETGAAAFAGRRPNGRSFSTSIGFAEFPCSRGFSFLRSLSCQPGHLAKTDLGVERSLVCCYYQQKARALFSVRQTLVGVMRRSEHFSPRESGISAKSSVPAFPESWHKAIFGATGIDSNGLSALSRGSTEPVWHGRDHRDLGLARWNAGARSSI